MSLAHTSNLGEWAGVSGELHRLAFDAAPALMALASRTGRTIRIGTANQAFRRLFDLPDAASWPIDQVFHGPSASPVKQAVGRCLDGGEPDGLQIAHRSRSGARLLEVDARRVLIGEEDFVLLTVSRALPPLSLSALGEPGVLAELGALSRGFVHVHDLAQGMIRCGFHPLLRRLGLSAGAFPAADALRLVDPDDQQVVSRFLRRQQEAGDAEIVQCVCRVRAANGETLRVRTRSQVLARSAEGQVQRVLNVSIDETRAHRRRAQASAAESAVAEAELDARRRIGRELHDSTAQALVAARLGLAALSGQGALSGEPLRLLEDARQAIDTAQEEIRNLTFVLHPPSFLEVGLEESLRRFAAGFARRTGLDIAVEVRRTRWRLPLAAKIALFRVAQEALMNVHRHAAADRVVLRLMRDAGHVILEVEDDGRGLPEGFDWELESVGVSGMRERIGQVGGEFQILPAFPGVLVRASVEMERAPRRSWRAASAQAQAGGEAMPDGPRVG
jgi:signal transduction histidine kinase